MKAVTLAASLFVVFIGALVLTGWALNIQALETVAPHLVTMKANTAIGLLLSGLGMALLAWSEPRRGGMSRFLIGAIATVVILIGVVTLSEYFIGWNIGIDQWLFHDSSSEVWTSQPGRMAPVSAFCLILMGGALLAGSQPVLSRLRVPILAGIGTSLAAIGGLALLGCLAEVWLHTPSWNDSGLAIHTAAGFLLLGCALLTHVARGQGLKWELDKVVTSGFIVAVIVMLLAAGVSFSFTNQLLETSHKVSHRQEVLKEIGTVEAGLANAESARRGYILMGDEKQLAGLKPAEATVYKGLADVRALTVDNPTQQHRLDQFEPLVSQSLDFSEQTIAARREGGLPAAQKLTSTGKGLQFSKAVNRMLTDMKETEYRLLDQDQERSRTTATSTFLVLPLGVFLSLTISSLGLFFLNAGVSERVRLEETLRASERQLGSFVEQAPVAIAMFDRNMIYLATSRLWANEFGRGHADLVGKYHYDILTDLPDEWKEVYRQGLAGVATRSDEDLWVAGDGTKHWLRWAVQPWQDAQGAIGGIMILTENITHRKNAERIGLENLRLEEENRRVAEANRLKSEFLANMSHELRTPLNGIIGFTELLSDERPGPLNVKQKEYLGDVLSSAHHLLQLINDVLDLAKVEAGKMDFDPETFDPSKAIEEVCAVVKGLANKKNIHLNAKTDPVLSAVTLDQRRFKQICYNLISNSLKFTERTGTVEIVTKPIGGDSFEVRVADTGIGIREEDMDRLFREFEQLESGSARRFEGTGLGLALTKKLVTMQGGSISAQSEYGKGSTFTVVLPLTVRELRDDL